MKNLIILLLMTTTVFAQQSGMVVIYNLQHTAIDKRWWKIAY